MSAAAGAQQIKFPDIHKHWAKSSIQWAIAKHIVIGYPDGTFKPDRATSEAEFLAMLIRIFNNTKKQADEMNADGHLQSRAHDWTDHYYQLAEQYNIYTRGSTDITYRNEPITRGQVAVMIAGAYGKNYNVEGAIAYLYDNGLAQGRKKKTIAGFEPDDHLTRAEAVTFLKTIVTKGLNGHMKKRPVVPEDHPSVHKYKH